MNRIFYRPIKKKRALTSYAYDKCIQTCTRFFFFILIYCKLKYFLTYSKLNNAVI